jgi:Fur family ferric uptake transcriptional regulator/Fur family peroxide stress response transcriptional regulator
MDNIVEVLKQKGISPSIQRVKILEFLRDHRIHPTTDMIYRALVQEVPTLSKTTVYNTLRLFVEKEILVGLSLFENEIRYEYNLEPHVHFRCKECGHIYDMDRDFDLYKDEIIDGHKVTEHHVNLKGICRDCLAKAAKAQK